MATSRPEFVDWLEEVFAPLGVIDTPRLFGGWQLRADGRAFGVVLGGTLYFRAVGLVADDLRHAGARPFTYAKAGKTVTVGRFLSAPEHIIDDEDVLREWAIRSLALAPD